VNTSQQHNTRKESEGQQDQLGTHPRDGYIIIQRRILDEGFSAYELSFLITCLLVAGHRKSKTPGVVKASTTQLGQLMGASQKTAWRCKQALIARGIMKALGSHEFVIVNYEDYQGLARTSLVPQTKNASEKGHHFSPTDLPLVPQTNDLVPQTSHKSYRLEASPTDYSPDTNQIAELNNKRSKYIKEVIPPPTTDESKMLGILKQLQGWRYDETDDLIWLRQFGIEFPQLGVAEVKACRDYYSGLKPPKHKGIWRNRLRNWMIKKGEFEKGGQRHGGARENRQRPKFDIEFIKSGEDESES
jgi:hypothetical protein